MMVHSGYRLTVTTEPSVEPITLAEAKLHLRVDHSHEDDYITSLIVSARKEAENYTRRAFVNTTFRLSMDHWPRVIYLPRGKVQSVTSVKYYDTNGTQQTLATSVYDVDTDSEPGRIVEAYNQSWPDYRDIVNTIQVVYVAGYGAAAANVPDNVKQAIKIYTGHLYENREVTISGTIIAEIPLAYRALLDPVRMESMF